jgi:dienelactone hydrolase
MRFYLNFSLVFGYVLMAVSTCLGMLQFAAARGEYAGLCLFTPARKRGLIIGAGLTVGAVLAYVLFAPEILTPGPAGTETTALFVLCALAALGITLIGADRRIKRARAARRPQDVGQTVPLGSLSATLYGASPRPTNHGRPVVILLPDPTGFVVAPPALTDALRQAGLTVLVLDAQGVSDSRAPLSRKTLEGHLAGALGQLAQHTTAPSRVGLIGLGLGGNAVLGAAATAPQINAAVAVSPVGNTLPKPGLQWLHELSYLQVWRWRRRWKTYQHAAIQLGAAQPTRAEFDDITAVLQSEHDFMAMRKDRRRIERLITPGRRRFTLLQDSTARQLLVNWLSQKLDTTDGINHVA